MEFVETEPADAQPIATQRAIDSLEEAFKELDANGLGSLGMEDFQDLLFACGNTATPDEAQAIFKSIDTDGSGGIDKDEVRPYLPSTPFSLTAQSVSAAPRRIAPLPIILTSRTLSTRRRSRW